LTHTLDIIEKKDIKVTIFCTHKTDLLDRMRKNPNIELGIHPNFNFLLNGDFRYGKNIKEVIEYYLNIVPEAVSVRSHSVTQNSAILSAFSDFGIKYDCNHFIPLHLEMNLKPWLHCNGKLIKTPYCWEDDCHCLYQYSWDVQKHINMEGLKIFNFHPIHIFLNTDEPSRYENYKKHQGNSCINNQTDGIKTFFLKLTEEIE